MLIFFILFYSPFLSAQPPAEEQQHSIYVASISWHTGILLPAHSLPDSIWSEGHRYAPEEYLEIGWGDRDYFQHKGGFHLWYAIKAMLWPTPSALHLNPVPSDIENYYRNSRVVEIKVNNTQLQELSRYVLEHFEFNQEGRLIPLEEGFYPDSQFFAGSSSYHFPKNSNVWIARALKRAGFDVSPVWYQFTGSLLNKAEDFGKLVVDE